MRLIEFIEVQAKSIDINWNDIEEDLEFKLHDNIKDFYSKVRDTKIKGLINFNKQWVVSLGNERNDNWLIKLEDDTVEIFLRPLKRADDIFEQIESNFEDWTGGNDFGNRICIGEFSFSSIGQVLILINNDTGNIEWVDCGYGYFEVYEENPNGILANNLQSFLETIRLNELQ